MKSSEAIAQILQSEGRTKKSLAFELGITPQALDSRMKASIKVETLVNTTEPLGYKLVLVPANEPVLGFQIDA